MGANKSVGQKDSVTVTVRRGVMISAMIISLCFVIVGYKRFANHSRNRRPHYGRGDRGVQERNGVG